MSMSHTFSPSAGGRSSAIVAGADTAAPELSVVLPCLNEARTVGACIEKILHTLTEHNIRGEVVVADNGSTDDSRAIAEGLGVRVVSVQRKGYGSALMAGIAAATGQYVLMADCDDTYDFTHIPRFLHKLRQGYDLVMGNRFQGGIAKGAMPALHRYIGNPLLSLLGRLFFRATSTDLHCGMRAFSKSAYEKLGMRTPGMEFASEMVVKATLLRLRVTEVPTTLFPTRLGRQSHLRTWRDGWRHLRFMLLYSPNWLFLYPGAVLILVGLCTSAWLLPRPRVMYGITFDVHTLLYAMIAILIGSQAIAFAVFTRIYASHAGLLPQNACLERTLRFITLEAGLGVGILLVLAGVTGSIYTVHLWEHQNFGPLNASVTLRTVIPSVTAIILGCQVTLFSFFLSVLGLVPLSQTASALGKMHKNTKKLDHSTRLDLR